MLGPSSPVLSRAPGRSPSNSSEKVQKFRGIRSGSCWIKKVDLVVRTAAVPDKNQEMVAASALGLKTVKYAQMLGMVMGERFGVAVAGTHGKSTTSAMISFALAECGVDPSFVIGGTVPQLGGGSHSGAGTSSSPRPANSTAASTISAPPSPSSPTSRKTISITTATSMKSSKASATSPDACRAMALIIANGRDRQVAQAISGLPTPIETVALKENFIWSTRVLGIDNGCYRGEVSYRGQPVGTLRLSIAGEHNLLNATMAVAACAACGVSGR